MKHPRPVALAIPFCPATRRVLLITSRSHPNLWMFPKGGIEKGETPQQAAIREAWEEAGTPRNLSLDAVSEELLNVQVPHSKPPATWHCYAIRIESEDDLAADWDEKDERQREWLAVPEAQERIDKWSQGGLVNADEVNPAAENVDVKDHKGGKKKAVKGTAMAMALLKLLELEKF